MSITVTSGTSVEVVRSGLSEEAAAELLRTRVPRHGSVLAMEALPATESFRVVALTPAGHERCEHCGRAGAR